jgi:hypothetical protein
MRVLAVAAAIVVALAVVPGVALASHGQLHGTSATPLLAQVVLVALVALVVSGRRPVACFVGSVAHGATVALRSLAQHRRTRAG